MKNVNNKFLYLLLAIGLLSSCEEDLIVYDTPDGFVQFSSATASVLEDGGPFVSSVLLGSGSNEAGVSVPFTVTSSDPARYTITPASGMLEIPAGEFSANITITPIDNLDSDGDVSIEITLGTGALPVGIGGEGKFGASRSVTILDNDCPFDAAEFAGAYDLTMTLANGFIYAAGTYEIGAVLQVGSDPNTLIDPDFGYLGSSGRTPVPVVLKFDPSTATVVMEGDAFTFIDGSSVTDAVYAYGTTPGRRFFTGNGEGPLLTCSESFTVNAYIRREDGTIGQILTLTYTKK